MHQDLHYIGPKRKERTRLRNYSKKINENFSKEERKESNKFRKCWEFLYKKSQGRTLCQNTHVNHIGKKLKDKEKILKAAKGKAINNKQGNSIRLSSDFVHQKLWRQEGICMI